MHEQAVRAFVFASPLLGGLRALGGKEKTKLVVYGATICNVKEGIRERKPKLLGLQPQAKAPLVSTEIGASSNRLLIEAGYFCVKFCLN